MCALVLEQCGQAGEALLALSAGIWLLPRVRAVVSGQCGLVDKSFTALPAGIGSLTHVGLPMLGPMLLMGKAAAAIGTRIWPFGQLLLGRKGHCSTIQKAQVSLL